MNIYKGGKLFILRHNADNLRQSVGTEQTRKALLVQTETALNWSQRLINLAYLQPPTLTDIEKIKRVL